jgi:hypothetical protein
MAHAPRRCVGPMCRTQSIPCRRLALGQFAKRVPDDHRKCPIPYPKMRALVRETAEPASTARRLDRLVLRSRGATRRSSQREVSFGTGHPLKSHSRIQFCCPHSPLRLRTPRQFSEGRARAGRPLIARALGTVPKIFALVRGSWEVHMASRTPYPALMYHQIAPPKKCYRCSGILGLARPVRVRGRHRLALGR